MAEAEQKLVERYSCTEAQAKTIIRLIEQVAIAEKSTIEVTARGAIALLDAGLTPALVIQSMESMLK